MAAEREDRFASAGAGTRPRAESHEFEVVFNEAVAPTDVGQTVERLTNPAAAETTLHWGRNYLYAATLDTDAGPVEVVVKQFRHQGLVARWRRRRRGSKAEKSWRAAMALWEAGVPTAEPIALAESRALEGASFFATRRLTDVVESRYIFRALAGGNEEELFPEIDREGLMIALGRLCRRLHDAGIWHRDISIGNLLVRPRVGQRQPEVFIVDLNRARLGRRLGLMRRTRDLCRLPLVSAADRETVLSSYWETEIDRWGLRYLLLAALATGFTWRIGLKERARRPLRALVRLARGRRAYTHIPPAPAGAAARDKAVWDHLSDQPHQHAGRAERARVRLSDLGSHLEAAKACAAALPAVGRRFRLLAQRRFATSVPWGGVGVALRPRPEDPEGLVAALEETGARQVLLRLHPWNDDHRAEAELAAELHRRGYDLAFSVPQNRDLVADLERWRGAVEEIAETFRPFGRHFQVGQAVNRSKWGIWTYREYLDLVAAAGEILRRVPGTMLLGPAVIDFELQATAAILNLRRDDVFFDIVSSLLYVDRRGAPENRQLGFDSVGKATLVKALAETSRSSGEECWVTEVNWPLREGPHAPAGRDVAVDEDTQADYLARYYLQMLTCGMVARVYWWQLVARGYGLTVAEADGSLRRRASHRTLAALESRLRGTLFEEKLESPAGVWLLRFRDAAGGRLLVGWSTTGPSEVELPRPARAAFDRDGEALPPPAGSAVSLDASPRYFQL